MGPRQSVCSNVFCYGFGVNSHVVLMELTPYRPRQVAHAYPNQIQRFGNRANRFGRFASNFINFVNAADTTYRAYNSVKDHIPSFDWRSKAVEPSRAPAPKKSMDSLKRKSTIRQKYSNVKRRRIARNRLFTGSLGGNFRKKFNLYKAPKYNRFGFVRRTEAKFEKTSDGTVKRAVYVGHGMAMEQALAMVVGAIVIKSFRKIGHKVLTLQEKIQGETNTTYTTPIGSWTLSYQDSGDVIGTLSGTIATDTRYVDVVSNVVNALVAKDFSGTAHYNLELLQFWLVRDDSTAPVRDGVVQLQGAYIDFDWWSSMTMQNRTPADGGTSTDNALDIANNPLIGKAYYGFGNGTNLAFSNNTTSVASDQRLLASVTTGFIFWDIDNATPGAITGEMDKLYKRPPGPHAFSRVKNCVNVSLNPGEIRNSFLRQKKKMSLLHFLSKLKPYLDGTLSNQNHTYLGKFALFGWQKKCDVSTESSLVTVGCEINQAYKCFIKEKRPVLIPQHQVLV